MSLQNALVSQPLFSPFGRAHSSDVFGAGSGVETVVPERGGLFLGAKSTLSETCIWGLERFEIREAVQVVSRKVAQCLGPRSLFKPGASTNGAQYERSVAS